MIDVRIKIFEHGPLGLQVNVFGSGAANSMREQIYLEETQAAISAGLAAAGKRVEAAGLGAPLAPEFLATVEKGQAGPAPAPLSPDAVELKLAAPALQAPRPPLFSEFAHNLLKEIKAVAAEERECNLCEGAIAMADRLVGMVTGRCNEFTSAVIRYGTWVRTQRQDNLHGKN